MEENSYDAISVKILTYLYHRARGENEIPEEKYLQPGASGYLPVTEEYRDYILDDLAEQGLIDMKVRKAWGGVIVSRDIDRVKITPKGIHYIEDNHLVESVQQ